MSKDMKRNLNEKGEEMNPEQYRWQTTTAKHWDQVLDHEEKRIIALEDNHNHRVDTYIAICDEEYHRLAQQEDIIAVCHYSLLLGHRACIADSTQPFVLGEVECLNHPCYFRPEHEEIKERQVLEHMCASSPRPKLKVYEIHHWRADLPNPYISWTKELPPSSRQQRGKKWLVLNEFELEGTGTRQKWPEEWPWGGMGKEEEILIRSGFHNPGGVIKVARAQARAQVKAWKKEKKKVRLREEEEARLGKEEDLRTGKTNRARQTEREASKSKGREIEAMQKASEVQERMESETQKTIASLPSQRRPTIASEVASPNPRRLLGNIANVLGKALTQDRKNSNKVHLTQDQTSIESIDSEARQETQEQDISESDASSQSHTKQSTGVDSKWSLRNAIKNNLTRVGVRHVGERERGGVDASAPAQGLPSTESSDSSAQLTPQTQQNNSELQVPLQSQATRLSAQLNGRSRVNGQGSLHSAGRQAQGQQISYPSKRQRAQTVVRSNVESSDSTKSRRAQGSQEGNMMTITIPEMRTRQGSIVQPQTRGRQSFESITSQSATGANDQNTRPRYSYEGSEKYFGDPHYQPGEQERSVGDQRQAPGREVYQREDGSF